MFAGVGVCGLAFGSLLMMDAVRYNGSLNEGMSVGIWAVIGLVHEYVGSITAHSADTMHTFVLTYRTRRRTCSPSLQLSRPPGVLHCR